MPAKPSDAAWRSVSTGKYSSSSHRRANGIISSRAKARAVSLMARCSSVRSKSMAATVNGSVFGRQSMEKAPGSGRSGAESNSQSQCEVSGVDQPVAHRLQLKAEPPRYWGGEMAVGFRFVGGEHLVLAQRQPELDAAADGRQGHRAG